MEESQCSTLSSHHFPFIFFIQNSPAFHLSSLPSSLSLSLSLQTFPYIASTLIIIHVNEWVAYPEDDEENAGEEREKGDSMVDFLPWWGDSDGEGRGSTAPEGGGYSPRVSDNPIRTWVIFCHVAARKRRRKKQILTWGFAQWTLLIFIYFPFQWWYTHRVRKWKWLHNINTQLPYWIDLLIIIDDKQVVNSSWHHHEGHLYSSIHYYSTASVTILIIIYSVKCWMVYVGCLPSCFHLVHCYLFHWQLFGQCNSLKSLKLFYKAMK